MNIIKTTALLAGIIFFSNSIQAQNINWANLAPKNNTVINVNVGLDNGLVYGIGYGYKINSKLPLFLNADYSFPSGNNLTDDFKTRIGGQLRLYKAGNFQFITNVHGVFRRYENEYTRILNFGSEVSGIIGYYKPKWFIAGEAGFDKAVVSNFKSSQLYRDIFPAVQDGWYEHSTGGNFNYGIQLGFSLKRYDIYLKAGSVIEQDFKTLPLIPFYSSLGCSFKIK